MEMNRLSSRLCLRLALLIHLVICVAALDVTYPRIGVVYPKAGPDDVQWQINDVEDPSDLAIYLATYNGQNLTSEQLCIVCSASDGSTAITLTHPPSKGNSYTWMFYDNDEVIVLGDNYVAESVHFQIQGASSTTSISISPAIAAAIGVGGTVVVVAIGLLMGYFFFYRPRILRRKRETINTMPYTPSHPYSKHELDSKAGTITTRDSSSLRHANVKAASHHEMEVFPNAKSPSSAGVSSPSIAPSPGGELSVTARHSRLPPPWKGELPVSPVRHEMHHDQRVAPQELPGDFEMGNPQRTKEWY